MGGKRKGREEGERVNVLGEGAPLCILTLVARGLLDCSLSRLGRKRSRVGMGEVFRESKHGEV